ncbi:hypothetical protein F5B21DRAFT_93123 [Xylaria acuta]|nr:hypothetical protein F5B21DRAFT_93123 [Xylaria acuta]
MATAIPGMVDDWEYVDDDTFSVISLVSEDDSTEPSRGRSAVRSVTGLTDDPTHPSYRPRPESPTPNDSQSSDTKREPNNAQAVGRCGASVVDVVEPGTKRVHLGGKATSDNGLHAVCERIGSLARMLDGILSGPLLRDQSDGSPRHLRANCESLRSQLDWIQDKCRIYAQHPQAGLPIGFSDWMGILESELLKIQGRLNCPGMQYSYAPANDCYKKIEHLRTQMDEMITMKHNDFLKLRPPRMLVPRGNSPITNRKAYERTFNCIASGSRKNSLSHLRQELYTLRDQIVACLGEIHSCDHHGIYDPDQREKLATLTLSYKETKESLERMLSNRASDWMYVGGLTSYEFGQLNPDTISSLILQLREVTDVLFLERNKVQLRRRDGRREYERLVIGASSMDTLRTIDETLVSILRLSTRELA